MIENQVISKRLEQIAVEVARLKAQWQTDIATLDASINAILSGSTRDAFGRLRTSEPFSLFDSKQTFDNQPLIWDESLESGSGISSAHSTDTASTVITSTASTAGKFTRQTFMRFNYQPGKSQSINMTGILVRDTSGTGVKRRIGYFDDNNGLFFEDSEGAVGVVRRTYVTGVAVDNRVEQSAWNVDPMDGTGPSGITIDWSLTQIFTIDFEWLGVGRVRMGLNVDGATYIVHEFLNANVLDKVYMSTPNLPLRYQVETTASSPAVTMECICSSVISEGGQAKNGALRYASTQGTHVACASENVVYAIIGIRLKSTHIAETIDIEKVAIQIQDGSNTGEWIIILNPTVTGTFNYTGETNSGIEVGLGTGAPTVTGGTRLDGGFAQSTTGGGGSGGGTEAVLNAIRLGAAIDGTVDEIVLCWMPNGGTSGHEIEGSIHWRELS